MTGTLVELLRRAERERTAVIGPDASLSYAELDATSERIAAGLAAAGMGPGDLVAIAETKTAAAIAALYGILKLGAAYVPLDPASPARRSAAICEARAIRFAIAPARWRDKVGVAGGSAVELAASGGDPPAVDVSPDALAYVLHTSGSTGAPKGVPLSHANSRFFVDAAVEYWSIAADDRLAAQAPLHFDLSVFDLFCAAAASAAVVLVPAHYATFPRKIAELIERERVTVWNSVVSTLLLLLERGKLGSYDLSSLRAVIFSGEPMPLAPLARLREHFAGAELYNVYGQTEANSSLCFPVSELAAGAEVLPIGRPLPGFDVFEVDGELHVAAPTVGAGYLGNPEQTAARYVEDPREGRAGIVYRTGDRVRIDERGDFVFAGRVDNLVKTRGYRVELGEIERALEAIDGVERAVAVAVPDPLITNRIAAFVTSSGPGLEVSALAAALAAELPRYMVPDPIEIRDALPTTATGKVDRRALISDATRETTDTRE